MGNSNAGSVAGRYRRQLDGQHEEDAKRLGEYLTGSVAGKIRELGRVANARGAL